MYSAEQITPYRPRNELLFIRGVGELCHGASCRPEHLPLHRLMLYAVRALFSNRVVSLIKTLCHVRVITDFRFVLDANDHVMSWDIVDVADAWVEAFPASYGISLSEFLKLVETHRLDGDLRAALKERGATKLVGMTPVVMHEWDHYRRWPGFRENHPDLFKSAQPETSATILAFRPPTD